MWGRSEVMLRCFRRLEEIASSDTTVLIEGETGTGKELAAEAIHQHSTRREAAYIVVDCAAIPKDLIESELFGHVRGAFTGAEADRKGAFEVADGGTVFIDEIGELPLELQSRILGVLERRQVKRVGADQIRKVEVRVIAATNRDLREEVRAGRFREDLLFRLNVVSVSLPPLRERTGDIALLTERFLEDLVPPGGAPLTLRQEALQRLQTYDWPGNVRELRNIVDRGAAMSDLVFRVPEDLEQSFQFSLPPDPPLAQSPNPAPVPLPSKPGATLTEPLWRGRPYKEAKEAVLEDFERGYVVALLEEHHGNVSAAARAAGIHRNILHRMMARYGIGRDL
jgi:transcriptional regulator with GAF, ATPase, and Fis domain